jgi:hypothetical protein
MSINFRDSVLITLLDMRQRNGQVTALEAGRSRVRDPMRLITFIILIYLILPAAQGLGVYSASNRNEYQKHLNSVSGE